MNLLSSKQELARFGCSAIARDLVTIMEEWICDLRSNLDSLTIEDGGVEFYRTQGRIEALKTLITAITSIDSFVEEEDQNDNRGNSSS